MIKAIAYIAAALADLILILVIVYHMYLGDWHLPWLVLFACANGLGTMSIYAIESATQALDKL